MTAAPVTNSRRHDLDWLRIIAFALLIFYHIGMFYVTWDWHVKSRHAGPFAEPLMSLVNPWRLSLLFLISGVALRFVFDRTIAVGSRLGQLVAARSRRLLWPLLFGMLAIVPPQSWLQLLENGEITLGYLDFYPVYLGARVGEYSIIMPTWNHLWYVVYLLLYTLVLGLVARPLLRWMRGSGEPATARLLQRRGGPAMLLLIPLLPHILYRVVLDPYFPTTHDVVNDWANHAHSLTMLLTGFLLAKDPSFWRAVARALPALGVAVATLGLALSIAWSNWSFVENHVIALWAARVARIAYAWFVIVALLGIAQRWLNRPGPTLRYLTEAIFPYYILHQTLTVTAGYWLTRQGLPVAVEFLLVTTATIGGCVVLHECLIRRSRWLRPLFGLKPRAAKRPMRVSEPG